MDKLMQNKFILYHKPLQTSASFSMQSRLLPEPRCSTGHQKCSQDPVAAAAAPSATHGCSIHLLLLAWRVSGLPATKAQPPWHLVTLQQLPGLQLHCSAVSTTLHGQAVSLSVGQAVCPPSGNCLLPAFGVRERPLSFLLKGKQPFHRPVLTWFMCNRQKRSSCLSPD